MKLEKAAYSVNETAHILSIGRTKLYELAKSGDLPTAKIGRKTLFCSKDIESFIDRLHRTGSTR